MFQLLVTVSVSDPTHAGLYGNALSVIIDVLANIPNHTNQDFDRTARTVCEAFCDMASALAISSMVRSCSSLK